MIKTFLPLFASAALGVVAVDAAAQATPPPLSLQVYNAGAASFHVGSRAAQPDIVSPSYPLAAGGVMRAIIFLLVAALCCGSVHAAVPRQINYQGYLTSVGGAPVNATVQIGLKLYGVATAGTALHSETQTVAVINGVFNVVLGAQPANLLVLPFDVPYWLGVKVESDAEMAPRQPVTAAGYAIRAASAEVLAVSAIVPGSQISGALTGATLPAGALTGTIASSQLAPGLALAGTTTGTFGGPLTGNVTGNVSGSAAAFTGALAGDVTGTQGATVVSQMGGLPPNRYVSTDINGNVAIGTGTPTQTLQVNGVTSLGAPGSVYGFLVDGPSPGPYPSLGFNTYGTSYLAGVAGYGGLFQFQDGDGKFSYYTGSSAAAGAPHAFTPRLTILQDGKVGIGTDAPLYELDVRNSPASFIALRGASSASPNGIGVLAQASGSHGYGVYARTDGESAIALFGYAAGQYSTGVYGSGGYGGYGGYFEGTVKVAGNVNVVGNLSKSTGSFKIDHPLDPANKYLYHSFVESPDMMNIYNGNVTTDGEGDATILLPDYLEALNRDFRYQLTVIGQFARAIVASEIRDHRFSIKTDKPQVKVSWQVTGIRQDAYANAHPIRVEVDKPEAERGYYLHPQVFGQPTQKSIEWVRNPSLVRQGKESLK